jgi:TolB protein
MIQRFTYFDRFILALLTGLALAILLVAWRGDQVGAQVATVAPVDGATAVSTQAVIHLTFAQEMDTASADANTLLTFNPPVAGEGRWQGNTLLFRPAEPLQASINYTVTLQPAGLTSQLGRPLLRPFSWQFQTGAPRILYLAWDAQDREQLFAIPLDGSPAVPLSEAPDGVWEYAVSPDGATVVYTTLRPDGGSDLWAVAAAGGSPYPLLSCPEAACGGANWSADGRRLVYERRDLAPLGGSPGMPRLWLLDMATGQTIRFFENTQLVGSAGRWSPDGQWLAYVDPMERGVQVYNLNDGRSFIIYSSMGEPGVWSPDGRSLAVTALDTQGERFAVKLLRVALGENEGETADLSGDLEIEDGAPEWSPDGQWIAFTRKVARAAVGKQVWLMRPDGSDLSQLTNEPDIYHGPPRWSPDGRYLVFQRYLISEPSKRPTIWLLEVATGELRQLAEAGSQPDWLP